LEYPETLSFLEQLITNTTQASFHKLEYRIESLNSYISNIELIIQELSGKIEHYQNNTKQIQTSFQDINQDIYQIRLEVQQNQNNEYNSNSKYKTRNTELISKAQTNSLTTDDIILLLGMIYIKII
jgi:predicted  nucleic acid-binding Zn-ribbon protein